jgi:protein-tyrosine phosphatase
MIDVHSHILFDIDDGAKDIKESIAIIKKMKELGYEKIIVTPHYIDDTKYNSNNKKKMEDLKILQNNLLKENVNIDLYLGNEVFISPSIDEEIKKGEITTLNNSNYILIEIPLAHRYENDLDFFFNLMNKGYHIILAHPERYVIFQENPKLIDEYLNIGILFQGNIGSMSGRYGTKAKKLFKKLLKERKYFVLGSDIHHENSDYFNDFARDTKKIIKLTNIDYFKNLTESNPQNIINNVYINND